MDMQMETVKNEEALRSINVYQWSDIHKRRKIGQGGQGQIFEAELNPEGRTVVIKEVKPQPEFEDENATFCHEARMMARLQHPNIIQFHGVAAHSTDIANARGLCNLVMEFMPSGALHAAMFQEDNFVRFPWRSRVVIALQIAEGLEYIHSKGIIHFDIKPANVLLDLTDPSQPLCKICDFGVATDKEPDQALMQGGYGTPGRVAPEMVNDHKIDEKITEKADAYSFGVLLSELLSGKGHGFTDCIFRNRHVRFYFFWGVERHNTVPEWCFQHWRRLMRDCLTCKASTRPDFTDVAARLRDMLAALDSEDTDVNSLKASAISSDDDSFWEGYFDDESAKASSGDDEEDDNEEEDDEKFWAVREGNGLSRKSSCRMKA